MAPRRRPSEARIVEALSRGDDDILFSSGSREQGFGNELSDYDIFVVTRATQAIASSVVVVVDGAYVDYEMHRYVDVVALISALNGVDVSRLRDVWNITVDDLNTYYRVLTGRPLTRTVACAQLKTRCTKATIDALVRVWCGLRAAICLEEADQKWRLGQARSAYVSAREAAGWALDSFLARHGESYPSFKWRYEKLRRCVGEDSHLYRRAWALKALGDRDIGSFLDDVRVFGDDMGMADFRQWSLDDLVCRCHALTRVVEVGAVSHIVHNNAALYEITPAGREIWRMLEASPLLRELKDVNARRNVMPPGELDRFLRELTEQGLASLS